MRKRRKVLDVRRTQKKRTRESRATNVNWDGGDDESAGSGAESDDFFFSSTSKSTSEGKVRKDRDSANVGVEASKDEDNGPTEAEKRISRAKEYLKKLMRQGEEDGEDGDANDYVGEKLKLEALEASGRYVRNVADKMRVFTGYAARVHEEDAEENDDTSGDDNGIATASGALSSQKYRGHKLTATCVAISPGDREAFTGSKDCSIVRYDVESGKRLHVFRGRRRRKGAYMADVSARASELDAISRQECHTEQVLALDVSPDGRYLASGGIGRVVRIWDLRTNTHVVSLKGHRDTITAMSFRKTDAENVLVTGSCDRTIKLWNVDSQTYMETLFGHQSDIMGVHTLKGERIVSCGRDATARLWHVSNESQLVFRGRGGSIDCAAMLSSKRFVTGSDAGDLEMWSNLKKKSICRVASAHGEGNWISSVAAWESSDLIASGSCDGVVRFWKADVDAGSLEAVSNVDVDGFVNGMAFASSGRFLVAAVGQEHRLGRWWRMKGVRSGIAVVDISKAILE